MQALHCPQEAMLRGFLLGEVPEMEATAIGKHLAGCSHCGTTIGRLEADDPLVRIVRDSWRLSDSPIDAREQTLAERMCLPVSSIITDRVDYLSPAQQPDELGRLGIYRVLKILGSGGMGIVLQAEDTRLHRSVALKLMRPKLAADDEARQRFLREARAMAAVRHDHVASIFEVGEENGVPYLAMELLHGQTLGQWLRGDKLPPVAEVVRLGREAAAALAAAHDQGLIHRDIKPANLWREAPSGRLKLLDFGLARSQTMTSESGDQGPTVILTQVGVVLGTPSYMPPEQAQNQDVGPAADIYALGAVLYECLTGRPPFQAATLWDTVLLVIHEEPIPPRRLNPKLPRDLETICLKCLEKKPERRYGSIRELDEDLRRFAAGEPIRARPASTVERTLKWVRRHPAMATLAGVTGLALVAGVVVWMFITQQLRSEKDEAQRQRETAVTEKQAANEAREKVEHAKRDVEKSRATAESERDRVKAEWRRAETALYALNLFVAEEARQENRYQPFHEALDRCRPEMRHWEHHYLRAIHDRSTRVLIPSRAFTDDDESLRHVTRVAFTPDGKRLLVGGLRLELWDVEAARSLWMGKLTPSQVTDMVLSRDGRTATVLRDHSTSDDREVTNELTLWSVDVETGKEVFLRKFVFKYRFGENTVILAGPLCLSPDGTLLAGTMSDGSLRMWHVRTGEEQRTTLKGVTAHGRFSFSPAGKMLVWCTPNGKTSSDPLDVRLFELEGDATEKPPTLRETALFPAVFPGKRPLDWLAFHWSAGNKEVHIWFSDAEKGAVVRAWDVVNRQELVKLRRTIPGNAQRSVFSPNGELLVVSRQGEIQLVSRSKGQLVRSRSTDTFRLGTFTFSPDGEWLAYASGVTRDERTRGALDSGVHLWAVNPHPSFVMLGDPKEQSLGVTMADDGKTALVGYGSGRVACWNLETRQMTHSFKAHTRSVFGLALSADGKGLYTASPADGVRLWDTTTWKETRLAITPQVGLAACWVLSRPNGQSALLMEAKMMDGDERTSLQIRDVQTGAVVFALNEPNLSPTPVVLSPNGKLLAMGTWQSGVKVWDIAGNRVVHSFTIHQREVGALAFSSDSRYLAAGCQGGILKVWDLSTDELVYRAEEHPDAIWGLTFSNDDKRLFSLSSGAGNTARFSQLRVWDAATGQCVFTETLPQDKLRMRGLTLSPEGRFLVSRLAGGQIAVWDAPRAP